MKKNIILNISFYLFYIIVFFFSVTNSVMAAAKWTSLNTVGVGGITVTGGTQGATISDDGKHIFIFNGDNGTNKPYLKVLVRQSNGNYKLLSTITVNTSCGHCNDAAYLKSGGKEYIFAPQYDTDTKYFYRYELSSDYKSITATKKYSLPGKRATIAYNKDKNVFYTMVGYSAGGTNSKRLITYDAAFTTPTNLRYYGDGKTSATSSKGVGGALYSYQGISYYNDHIYIILSIGSDAFCTDPAKGYGFDTSTLCTGKYGKELITVINATTGDFSKFLYYGGDGELEVMFFDDSGNAYLSTIEAGNSVIRKVTNTNLYTYNELHAIYHMNGGSLSGTHGSGYSVSGDTILYNSSSSIKIGEAGGLTNLHDYNATSAINITKGGYSAKPGAEWCTNANGGGTCYSQSANYKVSNIADVSEDNKTINLYVNWVPNTYTITYDANGGSGAPSATSYTYATSGTTNLSSTIPTRSGYNFKGWSLSKTATSPSYTAGQAWNLSNASNYTLYAVWEQVSLSLTVSSDLIKNDQYLIIKVPFNISKSSFMTKVSSSQQLLLLDRNHNTNTRVVIRTSDILEVTDSTNKIDYTLLAIGDVNADGYKNNLDAQELAKYIIDKRSSISQTYLFAGDMDNNYTFKMNDTMRLLKALTQ